MNTDTVLTVDGNTLLEPDAIGAARPTLGGRLFQRFQTYEYIRNFLSRYAWMQVGGGRWSRWAVLTRTTWSRTTS